MGSSASLLKNDDKGGLPFRPKYFRHHLDQVIKLQRKTAVARRRVLECIQTNNKQPVIEHAKYAITLAETTYLYNIYIFSRLVSSFSQPAACIIIYDTHAVDHTSSNSLFTTPSVQRFGNAMVSSKSLHIMNSQQRVAVSVLLLCVTSAHTCPRAQTRHCARSPLRSWLRIKSCGIMLLMSSCAPSHWRS